MDRAARLLRGTLRVRVESAFPERVLNLCGAHGIAFGVGNFRFADQTQTGQRRFDRP